MARFDFQSPGSAFTNQIAETLAQRKAQERQQMLDQLTANADARAQEAAERQAEEHKAQLATHQQNMATSMQQQELQRLGALESPLDINEDPTARGYSSADMDLLRKYGRLAQYDPNAGLSAEDRQIWGEENLTQPSTGYVGTAQQRERKRLQGQSADFITSIMPKDPKAGQFLADFAKANDGILPPEIYAQFMQPGPEIVMFNEATGKFTDMQGKPVDGTTLPPNARIVQKGYPPQRQMGSWVYQGEDENGESVYFHSITGEQKKGPGISRRSSGAAKLGIPATTMRELDTALDAVGNDPRSVDETALSNYRSRAGRAIGNIDSKVISPAAKQIATQFLSDPAKASMAMQRGFEKDKTLTAKDMKDIEMLLDMFIPADRAAIFRDNPYVEEAPSGGITEWLKNIWSQDDEGQ